MGHAFAVGEVIEGARRVFQTADRLDGVPEVQEQLLVLPAHDVGLRVGQEAGAGQPVRQVGRGDVDARRVAADVEDPAQLDWPPRLRERRAIYAALVGGALAAALIPVAPPGIPIVAASAACLLGWRRS